MMPLTSNVPYVGSNFAKKGTSMDIRDAIKANNTAIEAIDLAAGID